jgi:hypothetical protein
MQLSRTATIAAMLAFTAASPLASQEAKGPGHGGVAVAVPVYKNARSGLPAT